jgi:hypothetical protein
MELRQMNRDAWECLRWGTSLRYWPWPQQFKLAAFITVRFSHFWRVNIVFSRLINTTIPRFHLDISRI